MTDSPLPHQPEKCSIKDCNKTIGLWRLTIKVWAKGHSKHNSEPLTIAVGITLCNRCKDKFHITDIPDLTSYIDQATDACHVARADLKTAELELLPMIVI